MTIHYTPRWKDDKGNKVIFPARNTLFDNEQDARDWMLSEGIFMIPFGLMTDGILQFEAHDGKTQIRHIPATLGALGKCCIIDGPDGPKSEPVEDPS